MTIGLHGIQRQGVVMVHRGARDDYQVAAALADVGLLERLVTDLYWASDRPGLARLASMLPQALRGGLTKRSHSHLPSVLVDQAFFTGAASFLLEKMKTVPYDWRRRAVRATDAHLGRLAGRLARRKNALLLSYSYYGYEAFRSYGKGGVLFQLHPHPLSVRRILQRELEQHPDCAASLAAEWELSLPASDFARLVDETRLADRFLAASSFTRKTLIENGAPANSVCVVPYGVDLQRFKPANRSPSDVLQLLFVGTINQRKGIKYLLQALRLLRHNIAVQLTVCGRPVDDLALFRSFGDQVRLLLSPTLPELQAAYQAADLFVLPSVAEGFGHVLLEALASGLPLLSTTHTGAPDLITDGCEGFIVQPARPELLAARIEWAVSHRRQLESMKRAARARAEFFTWDRFRTSIVAAVRGFLTSESAEPPRSAAAARKGV